MTEVETSERLAIKITKQDGNKSDVKLLCNLPRILKVNIRDVHKVLRLSGVILLEGVAVFARNFDDIPDVLLIFAGQILYHAKFRAFFGIKVEQGVDVVRV